MTAAGVCSNPMFCGHFPGRLKVQTVILHADDLARRSRKDYHDIMEPNDVFKGLDRLKTAPMSTYHSAGADERAAFLAEKGAAADKFVRQFFDSDIQCTLLVLHEEDWRARTKVDYGYILGSANRVWYPAAGAENPFFPKLAEFFANCPGDLRGQLCDCLGEPDADRAFRTACLLWWDNWMPHELTHNYQTADRVVFGLKWFVELFADYVAYAFLKAQDGRLGTETKAVELLAEILYRGGHDAVRFSSLEDFEKHYMGVGPANYCWYHGKFLLGVMDLYRRFGEDFIGATVRTFRVTDDSLVARIDSVCRGTAEWFGRWRGS